MSGSIPEKNQPINEFKTPEASYKINIPGAILNEMSKSDISIMLNKWAAGAKREEGRAGVVLII